MNIQVDDLSDGKVAELLNQHLKKMYEYSPPESVHALEEEKLKDPKVTFWSAYIEGTLAGCGALKELSSTAGEVKSMKTDDRFLRQGVAARILEAIMQTALQRGYQTLSLETGSHVAFTPAIKMYLKYGFIESGPFGDYQLDPHSKFFTLKL